MENINQLSSLILIVKAAIAVLMKRAKKKMILKRHRKPTKKLSDLKVGQVTLRINDRMRDRILHHKRGGETYLDILDRVFLHYEKCPNGLALHAKELTDELEQNIKEIEALARPQEE